MAGKSKRSLPPADKWKLMREAVEQGAKWTVARLWKHTPAPKGWTAADEERLRGLFEDETLREIAQRFRF